MIKSTKTNKWAEPCISIVLEEYMRWGVERESAQSNNCSYSSQETQNSPNVHLIFNLKRSRICIYERENTLRL